MFFPSYEGGISGEVELRPSVLCFRNDVIAKRTSFACSRGCGNLLYTIEALVTRKSDVMSGPILF